jgi:hypothetical protein
MVPSEGMNPTKISCEYAYALKSPWTCVRRKELGRMNGEELALAHLCLPRASKDVVASNCPNPEGRNWIGDWNLPEWVFNTVSRSSSRRLSKFWLQVRGDVRKFLDQYYCARIIHNKTQQNVATGRRGY